MKKTIILNGRKIDYTLEIKNVKNINVRVTPQKGLCVSVPINTDIKYAEECLRSKSDKILEILDRFKNPKEISEKQLTSNEKRIQKILLNGKEIKYSLQFKKIKRINLSISLQNGVRVSAPLGTSIRLIEKFMNDNADFITNTVSKQKKLAEEMPKPKEFKDGEYFYFLGEKKILKIFLSDENKVQIENDHIYLFVREPDSLPVKQKIMDNFLKTESEKYIVNMCRNLYSRFKKAGIAFPKEIKFRKMISCWGNCRPARSVLTFSTHLIQLPEKCIEAVICHEFTHFLHPNHSKAFYAQLTEFMPDWKIYDNIMKELQKEIIIRDSK